MYKIEITINNTKKLQVIGEFMGIISDIEAQALLNVEGASDIVVKSSGITITSKYRDPLLVKGKRLVLVTKPKVKSPEESMQVVHISSHIDHIVNYTNPAIRNIPCFMCEGDKTYKFSLLQ